MWNERRDVGDESEVVGLLLGQFRRSLLLAKVHDQEA
jgi:hypothetical protein